MTAAIVAAPLGSTTCFASWNSQSAARAIASSHRDDLVDEGCDVLEREVAGPQASSPSAIVRRRSSVTGWPAASERDIFAAPAGSTPTTRTLGPRLFDRGRDAGHQPPPPTGTNTVVDVRHLLEDLEADVP